MEEPDLKHTAGVFTLEWAKECIRIKADRIYTKSENISAELTITTTISTNSGHLHIGRLNLTSTRERSGLCKRMKERWETVDWDALIEQTCLKILILYRTGEPTITLSDYESDGVNDLIAPFLLVNQPTILFGQGGSGKSMFATYLAILASTGIPGVSTGLKCEKTNVLYLDWEAGPDEIVYRVRAICKGLGVEPPRENLKYRRCFQSLSHEVETIQRMVLDHNAGLVVLDSVGMACGGEPEKADSVLRYFAALRSLKCTTLNIDHISKGAEGKSSSPFGSVYKINMSRSVWECKIGDADDQNVLSVGFFHRKANFKKRSNPIALSYKFEGDTISIDKTDLSSDPELSGHMTVKDRLIRALFDGKKSTKQLSDELGIPHSSVRVTLLRFKGRHFSQIGSDWDVYSDVDNAVTV